MQREKPPEWREKQKGSRGIRRGQRYRLVFQFPIRELIGLGWWVKFGVKQDWQRINLQRQPVSFGLLNDLNRCFRHDGQQVEPLPLYTTGNPGELRKVL